MTTSEPITKEYLEDFLRENDSILLTGEYQGYYRLFMITKDRDGHYKYLAGKASITAPVARQLSSSFCNPQSVSWNSLIACYSEIRHAFPTLDDLVE